MLKLHTFVYENQSNFTFHQTLVGEREGERSLPSPIFSFATFSSSFPNIFYHYMFSWKKKKRKKNRNNQFLLELGYFEKTSKGLLLMEEKYVLLLVMHSKSERIIMPTDTDTEAKVN